MIKITGFNKGFLVGEQDLRPRENGCPVCQNQDRQKVFELQKSPDIHLLHCNNCYAVSASRLPTDKFLEQYYKSYYDNKKSGVTFGNIHRFAQHIFKQVKGISKKDSLHLLDFGGGSGHISYLVAEKLYGLKKNRIGITVTVVDYNDKTVASTIPGIQMQHSRDLQTIKNQRFDLIFASAIIEHIPYPAESLAIMLACLNEEGFFYARTPYVLPLLKAAHRFGIFLDFAYPSHIHDLGARFWENIILESWINGNFAIIKSQPSMVETSFRESIPRATLAYLLKFPWRFFPRSYKYVGGWEIFIKKEKEENS